MEQWYYRRDSRDFGPFTREGILNIFHRGIIDEDTPTRYGSLPWQPFRVYLSPHEDSGSVYMIKKYLRSFWNPEKRISLLVVIASTLLVFHLVTRNSGKEPPPPMPQSERLVTESPAGVIPEHKPYTHPLQETLTPEKVVYYTNLARSEMGLPELRTNVILDAIAEERARDMFEKGYFEHISPTGERASSLAQKIGYRYSILGENIAKGWYLNDKELVDGWMQSPGHRKNILNGNFAEIGVAVVKGIFEGSDAIIGVQVFAKQAGPVLEDAAGDRYRR